MYLNWPECSQYTGVKVFAGPCEQRVADTRGDKDSVYESK